MDQLAGGQHVRGYLASSDLTTAAAIPLFDDNGNSITPAIGQRLVIEECIVSNGASPSVVTVFADTNGSGTLDAGEELASFNLGISGIGAAPQSNGVIVSRVYKAGNVNRLMAVATAASVNSRVMIFGRLVNS